MPELNQEWIKEQLTAAKVKVASGKAVLKLLAAWEELPELSPAIVEEVLSVFPVLARGHALKQEESDDDYRWIDAQPGGIIVGDVVRVKADAYTEKLGTVHNGRVGKVIAVRYGDIIVNSTDDKKPPLAGAHYSPYKLEKRVRKAN
jgi:hypothetical protein